MVTIKGTQVKRDYIQSRQPGMLYMILLWFLPPKQFLDAFESAVFQYALIQSTRSFNLYLSGLSRTLWPPSSNFAVSTIATASYRRSYETFKVLTGNKFFFSAGKKISCRAVSSQRKCRKCAIMILWAFQFIPTAYVTNASLASLLMMQDEYSYDISADNITMFEGQLPSSLGTIFWKMVAKPQCIALFNC